MWRIGKECRAFLRTEAAPRSRTSSSRRPSHRISPWLVATSICRVLIWYFACFQQIWSEIPEPNQPRPGRVQQETAGSWAGHGEWTECQAVHDLLQVIQDVLSEWSCGFFLPFIKCLGLLLSIFENKHYICYKYTPLHSIFFEINGYNWGEFLGLNNLNSSRLK